MSRQGKIKVFISLIAVLVAAMLLVPPILGAVNFSYQFWPDSDYAQSDTKATLHTFGFSGPPYPVKVDWVDPDGDTVSYCAVGSCGPSYEQQVADNGVLIWRDFYFYISGQQRQSGTYTAIVYSYQSGFYTEMFREDFTISGTNPTPPAPRLCYVNASASGANTGNSWTDAYTDLQSTLGASTCTEVWVKSGVYKPTSGTSRTATFTLKNGVAIYGGFAGVETARDQRNPVANITILSGDVDNNDSQTPIITDTTTITGMTNNSYHVVTGATGAILDGFTVTAGYAMCPKSCSTCGYSCPTTTVLNWLIGGGMFNLSSSPTTANITFSGNWAGNGGGMGNYNNSHPIVTDVNFNNNFAYYGGGMMNRNSCNPVMTNVTFKDNWAWDLDAASVGSLGGSGGGMSSWSHSNPTLTNITFSGNYAEYGYGGGMENYQSNPVLTNATFDGNAALSGGGMYNDTSNPGIYNAIFWNNTASDAGPQIYDSGSTPSMNYSVVQGGYAGGTNIITTDPLLGVLGNHGGSTQTIPLLTGSSAIDVGSDAYCPATDQRGVTRPQGVHCDIGAFEVVNTPPTVLSITRIGNNPTNATSVDFMVIFSESVTGVDIADFTLTTSGISGAAVSGVSGSGSTYTVSVSTGLGNGTLRLDVTDNDSIIDEASNPLGGAGAGDGNFTDGEMYTIMKEQTLFLPLILR